MPDEQIRIIDDKISLTELKTIAEESFGDMVKVVVDIDKNFMALGGELHADEEQILIANGSQQKNLWGINLYPDLTGDDFIEFDSLINIRPRQNNRSRGVENEEIRKAIATVVKKLVQ